MAKLIQSDGAEENVIPTTRRGFRWDDVVRLIGPNLLLVPLNASIVLIVSATGFGQAVRNDKATRIAQFAFSDNCYEVYGDALFATADELEFFFEEIREEEEAQERAENRRLLAQERRLKRCRQPRRMPPTRC